jgi:alpha-mannosidase
MHDDRKLIEGHIDRIFRERLVPAVYGARCVVEVARWDAPGEPVPPATAIAAEYTHAAVGEPWGPAWGTTWFRVRGRVPPEWAGRIVELVVDLGFDDRQAGFQCEALVFRADGTPVKGLHSRSRHVRVGGEEVLFYIEAAANPIFPRDLPLHPTTLGDPPWAQRSGAPLYRLEQAELRVFLPAVWELVQDIDVASQLMRELPVDCARRWELMRALERALDGLDPGDLAGSASRARELLKDTLSRPAHASAHRIAAVGHAHIDSAWLWPVRETVRKVARTVSNVAALMDEHPDFVFAMSQAQHGAWMKERYPAVFARMKEKVGQGTLVPVGGMWVESDTNLAGGEALARQFVHGKRFFLEELGVETDVVWLPDCFGYSAALPQLMALSQSRYFLTQKISWNQTNRFPHHSFLWEGLDGTRIFTHFPSADTYNAQLSGEEVAHAAKNFAEKGSAGWSLMPFGWGDGGGGPTREMLARAERLRDLEGSPRVTLEAPSSFFRRAEAEHARVPVWTGELYLELHRGTYTTQARTKRGNRRCELFFREAELWCATATLGAGLDYPYDALDRLWKELLLHQFHDILPGCSIAWVHRETELAHAEIAAELGPLIERAQRVLAGAGAVSIAFNAAPHAQGGVPALGAAHHEESACAVTITEHDGGFTLDNGLLTVHLDGAGLVTSLIDRQAHRDVIPPGARANLLQLHPDIPNMWDAWDIEPFYRNTVTDLTQVESIEAESLWKACATVRVTRRAGTSTFVQRITLAAGERRLTLHTEIDWQERETFLKLAFPLDVHASSAKSEIQFGHVERATHENTSWDAARFEVCAHRWVHVGEPGYGVALINDGAYGHDMRRSAKPGGGTTTTVRASLLRAPGFPDPETDRGLQHFRHVLVPGATVADAVREGYHGNLPLRIVQGERAVAPLITVDDPAVVVEAVKLADDRSGDLVVRLYEAHGGRAKAHVELTPAFARVFSTDLLERVFPGTVDYAVGGGGFDLALRPFEIVTLRMVR